MSKKQEQQLENLSAVDLLKMYNNMVAKSKRRSSFASKDEAITYIRQAAREQVKGEDARRSRLPVDAIRAAFKGMERSVQDAAAIVSAAVGKPVSDRDVRLGIDQLRRKGEAVQRTKLKHFKIAS